MNTDEFSESMTIFCVIKQRNNRKTRPEIKYYLNPTCIFCSFLVNIELLVQIFHAYTNLLNLNHFNKRSESIDEKLFKASVIILQDFFHISVSYSF